MDPLRAGARLESHKKRFSSAAVAYAKEIARREHYHNVLVPYSVCSSRLFQRLSVAIQRAVTYNVMEYRATRVPVAVPGLAAARGAVPVLPVQGGQDDDDDSDVDM